MKKHIIAAQFAFATNILFPKIASAQNVKSDNMHLLEQIFLALNLIFQYCTYLQMALKSELLTSQYTDETVMRQLTNKVFIFEICSENHIQSDESPASENMIDF